MSIEKVVYGIEDDERNEVGSPSYQKAKEHECDISSDEGTKSTKPYKTKLNEQWIKGPLDSYITRAVDMNNTQSKASVCISSDDDDMDDETDFQLLTTDADDKKSNDSDYSDIKDLEGIEFEQLGLEFEADHQSTTEQGTDQ